MRWIVPILALATTAAASYEFTWPHELITRAEVIAYGQVLAVRGGEYRFRVIRQLGGKPTRELPVRCFQNWTCASREPYREGERFILFARRLKGRWHGIGAGNEGEWLIRDGTIRLFHADVPLAPVLDAVAEMRAGYPKRTAALLRSENVVTRRLALDALGWDENHKPDAALAASLLPLLGSSDEFLRIESARNFEKATGRAPTVAEARAAVAAATAPQVSIPLLALLTRLDGTQPADFARLYRLLADHEVSLRARNHIDEQLESARPRVADPAAVVGDARAFLTGPRNRTLRRPVLISLRRLHGLDVPRGRFDIERERQAWIERLR